MPSIGLRIQTLGMDRILLKLDEAQARLEAAPRRIVERSADVVTSELRIAAPKRTGELAANVYARVEGSRATFWDRKFYTPFVLHGTRPHDIWAGFYTGQSGKKALSWPGAEHPVTHVRHPGTKPDHFDKRALVASLPRIRAIVAETGRWVLGA